MGASRFLGDDRIMPFLAMETSIRILSCWFLMMVRTANEISAPLKRISSSSRSSFFEYHVKRQGASNLPALFSHFRRRPKRR